MTSQLQQQYRDMVNTGNINLFKPTVSPIPSFYNQVGTTNTLLNQIRSGTPGFGSQSEYNIPITIQGSMDSQTTDYTMFDPEDKSVGDLVIYDELLGMLAKKYSIEQITVSGGEISLLSDLYFDLLYNILKLYTKNIHIHTDFNTFNAALINGVDIITVPYNFTENENINFLKNIYLYFK